MQTAVDAWFSWSFCLPRQTCQASWALWRFDFNWPPVNTHHRDGWDYEAPAIVWSGAHRWGEKSYCCCLQECCLCSPCFVENGFVSWAEGRIKREQGSGFNNQVLPGENLKMGSSPTSPSIFSENWGWTAHLHLLRRDRPRGFSGATPHWKLPLWSGQMAFVLTSSLVWDWMFALRRSLWACSLKAIDQAVTVEKLFTSECIMWQTEVLPPVFEWRTLLRLIRSIYWGTANTNNIIYSRTQPILTIQHSHDTILSYHILSARKSTIVIAKKICPFQPQYSFTALTRREKPLASDLKSSGIWKSTRSKEACVLLHFSPSPHWVHIPKWLVNLNFSITVFMNSLMLT